MGMAASQARYLGLTARKSNCEWEGQQINQTRTALANQSANLFNQMLTLSVPSAPDKTNYTSLQYSYSDGSNSETISDWKQLSDSDDQYNYVVDHYYTANLYTGQEKDLSDPQVTIKGTVAANPMAYTDLTANTDGTYTYDTKKNDTNGNDIKYNFADLTSYTSNKDLDNAIEDAAKKGYISLGSTNPDLTKLTDSDNSKYSLMGYMDNDGTWHLSKSTELAGKTSDGYLNLSSYGITGSKGAWTIDDADAKSLAAQLGSDKTADDAKTWLNTNYDGTNKYYKVDGTSGTPANTTNVNNYGTTFTPTKIGNNSLTELNTLNADDETALEQIINDLPNSSIAQYFAKNADGDEVYSGSGIYKYTDNGTTKYTTYDDLVNSMQTSLFNNKPIDDQEALSTYQAAYISTKVSSTDKAMLQTDSNGRFTSVKFANDSTTYNLSCAETTNDDSYNDAMNEYNYQTSVYEQKIANINAQTEVIQEQDRTLELRLKQLDTEQNALQTEMDAVKKVISKNIETTFKTFGG